MQSGPPHEKILCRLTDLAVDARQVSGGHWILDRVEGRLGGGSLRGEGWLGDRTRSSEARNHLQLRCEGVLLDRLFSGPGVAGMDLRGSLGAFLSARWPDDDPRHVQAGGWIEAKRGALWDLPPFAAVLSLLELEAIGGESLRSARVRWHAERGRLQLEEMVALAAPVSLFGHGSIDLADGEIDAVFVPRIGSGLLEDLPLLGKPTQLLLEVVKGTLYEITLEGPISDPELGQRPLPVVTRPIQAFLDLFESGEDR